MKKVLRFLMYGSILIVLYYLYQFDYFVFAELKFNYPLLLLSVLLLWAGFFQSTMSWRRALKAHQISIGRRDAIYSHGISVFAKYIPGKIWVILGRASIVSEKGFSLAACSTISLKEQLVYLLIGLIISAFALPFIEISPLIILVVILTAIALALFLFSRRIYNLIMAILAKLMKKELEVPFVGVKKALSFSYTILSYWALWSLAFFLLCKSMIFDVPVLAAFIFPVSVCYGLLAVIIPGGIGVREGVIVFLLSAIGVDPEVAVTLSVIQRLWFITGELFIFGLALCCKNRLLRRDHEK